MDHGGFREVANVLNISPPALSLSIKGLEEPRPLIGEATDDFFINLIANSNSVAMLPMTGSFKDAIESGQLAELHVPKVDWSSNVAVVFRTDENLPPDARLLRDETRAALSEIRL